jgi:hypothetical protein
LGDQAAARNNDSPSAGGIQTPLRVCFRYGDGLAGVGDSDTAFQWLEKAYAQRESQMAFLNITRRMDPLRSDPRFADLLRRMGLSVRLASN